MSNATRHFPEELLLDYSTGALSKSWALAIDVHAEYCSECRATLNTFENFGGELLMRAEPAEVSEETRNAVLRTIAMDAPANETATAKSESVLPAVLRAVLGCDLEDIKWRSIGAGIKQKIIHSGDEAVARLLYIPAGVATPPHSHRGNEATVVLAGGFYDGDESFTLGDVEFTDQTEPHTPQAMNDGPCITLAVTDAPLKFVGLIPSLIQPFLKI
ncbi:MAG: transcriptional regulator [Marinicaulis sp.]|nr:transcriptional regulator [Marinicaulis sp.]